MLLRPPTATIRCCAGYTCWVPLERGSHWSACVPRACAVQPCVAWLVATCWCARARALPLVSQFAWRRHNVGRFVSAVAHSHLCRATAQRRAVPAAAVAAVLLPPGCPRSKLPLARSSARRGTCARQVSRLSGKARAGECARWHWCWCWSWSCRWCWCWCWWWCWWWCLSVGGAGGTAAAGVGAGVRVRTCPRTPTLPRQSRVVRARTCT